MAAFDLSLSEQESQQLAALATERQLTPEALVSRWVRERLAHERERAAGGGEARSPRARRESESQGCSESQPSPSVG